MPQVRTHCPKFGHLDFKLKSYFLHGNFFSLKNCEWTISSEIVSAFEWGFTYFFIHCMQVRDHWSYSELIHTILAIHGYWKENRWQSWIRIHDNFVMRSQKRKKNIVSGSLHYIYVLINYQSIRSIWQKTLMNNQRKNLLRLHSTYFFSQKNPEL